MKYYAIKSGKISNTIVTTWSECESLVKGFKGAKFKAFSTQDEAQYYLDQDDQILVSFPTEKGIFVDGASSIKNNTWEYRLCWNDGTEIYRSPVFTEGSNNIAEFMAIVAALKMCKTNSWNYVIYSDSITAITWISKRYVNTKTENTSDEVREMLKMAVEWLNSNSWENKIVHYNNGLIGVENPADFHNK